MYSSTKTISTIHKPKLVIALLKKLTKFMNCRHFQREMRFQTKQIACKVAFIQDDFSIKVDKHDVSGDLDVVEQHFISLSKPVPVSSCPQGFTTTTTQGLTSSQSSDITDESAASWPTHSFTSSISGSQSSRSFLSHSGKEKAGNKS